MRILAIETSCDETGICILEGNSTSTPGGNASEGHADSSFEKLTLLGNTLASQIELHAKFGGVFPTMAKRAHAEKLVPLLIETLEQAQLLRATETIISPEPLAFIEPLREKDPDLIESLLQFFKTTGKPDIDYIAVTSGPGLEPALWVGVNAARILSRVWEIPLVAINHMEGHVVTAFFERHEKDEKQVFMRRAFEFPVLSLLVSGGHTELVLSEAPGVYKKIGQTRDDAVGEAFDKVARVLGLSYPGGPKISALAKEFRAKQASEGTAQPFVFPRPMQHSGDFDFSYSGLKTAVLYTVQKLQKEIRAGVDSGTEKIAELTNEHKLALAAAFEDAAIEVLVHKVMKAIDAFKPKTFLIGGGVAGNEHLQSELTKKISAAHKDLSKDPAGFAEVQFLIPERQFTTDNAVMIGLAAFLQLRGGAKTYSATDLHLKANGNLSIEEK